MEIKEHPNGFEVSGPFGPDDALTLIAAIQNSVGPDVRCIEPSSEDAASLVELLTGIQPWIEEEDRTLSLIVQGSEGSWDTFAQLNREGSRIKFVGVRRVPES